MVLGVIEILTINFVFSIDPAFVRYKVDRTNRNHNGKLPRVTNVFFTHGSVNPWQPMGVLTDVNADSPVVILEGYSHAQDLCGRYPNTNDTQQMRETRIRITDSVRKWLGL